MFISAFSACNTWLFIMTKSAVKAYGKVYLIFYINIPKICAHLYRQHSDLKSTGSVKPLDACLWIYKYIHFYKNICETTINLAGLHLKTFDFMFIHALKENQVYFQIIGKENLAAVSSEVRNNISIPGKFFIILFCLFNLEGSILITLRGILLA